MEVFCCFSKLLLMHYAAYYELCFIGNIKQCPKVFLVRLPVDFMDWEGQNVVPSL